MKNRLLNLALAVSVCFVGGCSYEKGPPSANESAFKASIDPKPEPNRYEVRLSWKTDDSAGSWVIHRQGNEPSPRLISTLEAKTSEYVDSLVIPGEKYRYVLGTMNGGSFSVVSEASVTVPKDIAVKDRLVVSELKGVGRLFLGSTSHVVTEGKDATISVDEIISDNGIIESFSEGAAALAEKPGRNGGLLIIKARKGSGTLRVYARGENGGNGLPGTPGQNGKKGEAGKFAMSTHESVEVVCNCEHRARELREQIKQGNIFAHFQFVAERMRHRCMRDPGDGTQGAPGTAGGHGSHGGRGGDSAKVSVEVGDPSAIKIDVFFMPGRGGGGGAGGRAGYGGPGGDPGDRALDFFGVCKEPKPGPMGLAGLDGKPGLSGQNGNEQPLCLNLGGQKSPDCNKF